jgi:hypothetical protein
LKINSRIPSDMNIVNNPTDSGLAAVFGGMCDSIILKALPTSQRYAFVHSVLRFAVTYMVAHSSTMYGMQLIPPGKGVRTVKKQTVHT